MMADGKKKPEDTNTNIPGIECSFMEDTGGLLASSPKSSPDFEGPTKEQHIYELQVHQIKIETHAEDLRKPHLSRMVSRDRFFDLYDVSLAGYLTLTGKASITGVDRMGAILFGVEQNNPVNHGFGRFISPRDLEGWDQYFMHVRNRREIQICTLMLTRGTDRLSLHDWKEAGLPAATGG